MSDRSVSLRLLSAEEYAAHFQPPMADVTETADQILDIWPYVDSVPASDFGDLALHDVEFVFRNPTTSYEHVLLGTCEENSYLVIIIDCTAIAILGHYFLDLIERYDLNEPATR